MELFVDVKANAMEGLMALREGKTILIDPKGVNTLLHSLEIFKEHLNYEVVGTMRGTQPAYFVERKGSTMNILNKDTIYTQDFVNQLNAAVGAEVCSLENGVGSPMDVVCQQSSVYDPDNLMTGTAIISADVQDPEKAYLTVTGEQAAWGKMWSVQPTQDFMEGLVKVAKDSYHFEALMGYLAGRQEATRLPEQDF